MNTSKKALIAIAFSLISSTSYAKSAYSAIVEVEKIEFVRGDGFLIYGKFGNPSECDTDPANDSVWVPASHTDYDRIYSMAMSAFMAGKKVQAYTQICSATNFYSGTYSTVGQAFKLVH